MTNEIEEAGGYEGYTALWGCDPCYDRAPRLPGDGYLFYNFSVENTLEFLNKFLPAIERTIQEVQERQTDFDAEDVDNLMELKEEVKRRIKSK